MTDTQDTKEHNNRFGLELALGQQQAYQDQYNPALLQPIARSICREHLPLQALPNQQFKGVDVWTGYELSWLDETGKPCAAIAEFNVPANSPNIIESKSFKYYLNSFNQTRISQIQLEKTLIKDLTQAAGQPVGLKVIGLNDYQHPPTRIQGFTCVDDLALVNPSYTPSATLLQPTALATSDNAAPHTTKQQLFSHLLKSNCPVTGQPDWASVWIEIEGAAITPASFLAYIVSYRGHQDFHENCVEQMYCDLWQTLKPSSLWVYARYTRRGGLDINPFRSSHNQMPPSIKGARQ